MKPMLAGEADLAKLTFPLVASPKLDGIRCLIIDGVPTSRSLKPLPNQNLHAFLGHKQLDGMDGEIVVGDATAKDVYRRTVSHVMSDDIALGPYTYYVFDLFDCPDAGYGLRRKKLEQRVAKLKGFPNVKVLEQEWITDLGALMGYESQKLEEGFEGVILRDPGGKYKYGRSTTKEGILLKLKRFTDAEAEIIGYEEQMHNTNEAQTNELGRTKRSTAKAGLVGKGTLGALVCVDENGITFKIGTGFDDALKQDIWNRQKELKGQFVKYKSFKIGVKDAPRHPVFLGFRDRRDM